MRKRKNDRQWVHSKADWLRELREERWLRGIVHTKRGEQELVASYCLVEVRWGTPPTGSLQGRLMTESFSGGRGSAEVHHYVKCTTTFFFHAIFSHSCVLRQPFSDLLCSARWPHFNWKCPRDALLWATVQKHITLNQSEKYKDNHWP